MKLDKSSETVLGQEICTYEGRWVQNSRAQACWEPDARLPNGWTQTIASVGGTLHRGGGRPFNYNINIWYVQHWTYTYIDWGLGFGVLYKTLGYIRERKRCISILLIPWVAQLCTERGLHFSRPVIMITSWLLVILGLVLMTPGLVSELTCIQNYTRDIII